MKNSLNLTLILICISLSALADTRIKIGVSVPLTGPGTAYGTDIKNALVFMNERYANSKYDLIIEDDQCSDKEAVAVAHKLVDVEQVKYVLGFGCSGTVLATAPVYEKGRVVVIASGTGAPNITNAGDYIFRTKPSFDIMADILAKEMAAKFKKMGILAEETAPNQALANALIRDAKPLGVEVIRKDYLPGTEDFKTLLLKLRSDGAQALYLLPQGEPGMITMYRQLMNSGWKVPVYGTFIPGSPAFLSAFGPQADGVIYSDLAFNHQMLDPRGLSLFSEFEQKYGTVKSAEHFATLSFLSFAVLDKAIHSGTDVKEYLYTHTFHDLVDGYSFDKNGDVVSERLTYALKKIEKGVPVPYP